MNLKKLAKPFPASEIEWRIGRSGTKSDGDVWALALVYLTARQVHDRLDEVVGPENWRMSYREHKSGTVCRIGIRVEGEWVFKEGGSDESIFEAFKGELSGAEKRAGVPWGIGRYLYNLDETFVEISLQKRKGWNYQSKGKNTPAFYWKNPSLPEWALPEDSEMKKVEETVRKEFEKPVPPPTEEDVEEIVRPYTAKTLKAKFAQAIAAYQGENPTYQVLAAQLGELLEEDADRYALTRYLTGNEGGSTKNLSNPQLFAFSVWLCGSGKLGFETEVKEVCKQEAQAALTAAKKSEGQEELL